MSTIAIIGGGAAGFFAAITAGAANSQASIQLFEKTNALLAKVKISGGGRCNVTHACFDPAILASNYPRGHKALLGVFHRFQPKDTIQWFETHGVELKTEEDGRMFPVTDSSETIIQCLMQAAEQARVQIKKQSPIESIEKQPGGEFILSFKDGSNFVCNRLLLATGSNKDGYEFARQLGHSIIPPVPSLFTFNIPSFALQELAGISAEEVLLKIDGGQRQQNGPLLITHWGFSGPAALKLSAWEARYLHGLDYKANLLINWVPQYSKQALLTLLLEIKQKSKTLIVNENPFRFAKQLWKKLLDRAAIDSEKRFADIPNKLLISLAEKLQADKYEINGKTTYKQEFVTCGGVALDEINFKTMESRVCPGLYFAGEILDIDGVTGGFNFQNAWSTGWIAGNSMIS